MGSGEARSGRLCSARRPAWFCATFPRSLQRELGVGETEEVQFVETTAEVNTYRDAVRFHNGRQALLQQLREGQRVHVLSIGVEEFEPAEAVLWTVSR